MAEILSEEERAALLPALEATGWRAAPDGDALRKVWKFRSFSQAWGFMARVALEAEKMDHHPDWRNSYNVVDIRLTTHSCGGLSVLDTELANCLDAIETEAEIMLDLSRPIACLCAEKAAAVAPEPPPEG